METSCLKWGMKINVGKCKIISNDQRDIMIEGSPVGQVTELTFLGSVIPGSESDVKRRIMLASSAFGRLKENIWSRKDIGKNLKIRLQSTNITLMRQRHVLLTFEMRCLRSILGVNLRQRLRNDYICHQLSAEDSCRIYSIH